MVEEGEGMLKGWSAEKIAKLNETASNSMIMFLVLNYSDFDCLNIK